MAKTLVYGTDYEFARYENNIGAGPGRAIIRGIGNFTGEAEVHFAIDQKNIGESDVTFAVDDFTYTGSAVTLTDADIEATYTAQGGKVNDLVLGTDYIVGYAESVNYTDVTGTAVSVTVTGCGNYQGSIDVNFTIAPKSIAADASRALRRRHLHLHGCGDHARRQQLHAAIQR